MNNYSQMRVATVFVLTVALLSSALAIPFVPRTVAEPLSPPEIPSDPNPENNSKNISISSILSWNCSDPDNDTMSFDIYFGDKNPPGKVETHYMNKTYSPDLKYSTQYFWQIIAWDDNNESNNGPIWTFSTKANTPPNVPTDEMPDNNSTGISIGTTVSWNCSDYDGDTLSYDVFLGPTTSPPKVSSNQAGKTYKPSPDLAFNTTYYWRIVAKDANDSTSGPLWHFTTGVESPITVTIITPLPGKIYIGGAERLTLPGNNTIVYGGITIEANVTSSKDIDRVEFLIDGVVKITDNETPYTYDWKPLIQFNSAFSLKRTITVIAYDSDNVSASANITVTKWRFHPLPWIMAGVALASRLILHTTVVGVFYNVQQSRFSVSFFTLRAHYKTVGPFQMRKGNIHFKTCSGGRTIGPMTLTYLGPFHRLAIGSFTFSGNVNAERIGLGGGLLSGVLQSRFMGGGLLNLFRNLRG